jgi:hypothetical protein
LAAEGLADSKIKNPDRRAGRHSAWGLACGIRHDHLGGHRKVDEVIKFAGIKVE